MSSDNASIPYEGRRSAVDCTVRPPEILKGIAANKAAIGQAIIEHASHMRSKVKTKVVKHTVTEKVYTRDGEMDAKSHVKTQRKEN